MEAWLIALLVFVSYGALVILLNQVGVFERLSVHAVGPLLIWRTLRFRRFIERIARPRRLWAGFGDLSIALMFISMLGMVVLLFWIATRVVYVAPGAIRIEQLIGLPAINPLIPLWYGIFGLAVAIVVHEGCHGVLARAQSLAVRSVGLLLLVVPIGAFVEPDETEMRKASLRTRLRVFSVGPSSNLVLALVCAAVFSMGMIGSLQPVSDGAYIAAVVEGSPADIAGLRPSTLITAVQLEGQAQPQHLTGYRDLSVVLADSTPHSNITLHYLTARGVGTVTFELGDWPAERIPPGEVLTRGWVGVSLEDPERYLAYARPGARIVDGCQQLPATPGNGCTADSVAGYLALPMQGLSPLPTERQWLYEPTGPWAALGGAFWIIADAFYWLFWLNLMVGAFNVLPMLPLDGGHMFRDGVHSLLRRFSRKPGITVEQEMAAPATVAAPARGPTGRGPRSEDDDFLGVSADRRPVDEVFGPTRDPLERRAHTITVYTSFLMLGLIIWQVIGSYVGNALGA